jgi:hypothetical protein
MFDVIACVMDKVKMKQNQILIKRPIVFIYQKLHSHTMRAIAALQHHLLLNFSTMFRELRHRGVPQGLQDASVDALSVETIPNATSQLF